MPRRVHSDRPGMVSLVLLLVMIRGFAAAAAEPALNVPLGFSIEQVAGPPAIQFPMFAALDDRGRLFVTESSGNDLYAELRELIRLCRIQLLEDWDGDGRYETATVFADRLTQSMGLVWHQGKLFAADPPDLVTLEDSDHDGRADRRTVLITGFGHTDNGSLHGLAFGPDGRLYFTMGSPDGYDLRGPDGSRARGTTGALIRCRPDGSGLETVARGFENLVEIAFMADGGIIGTVNWYQRPDRGMRDALVHILEGSQFPLHPVDREVPHMQWNAVLPPIALFPAVAHSGLAVYQGADFPPELRGQLFSAQHNTRKIVRHQLTPQGASYAVETFDFVTTDDPDTHFSDVLDDGNGGLLAVDTGSWYVQHCPTGRIRQAPARGAIYRVTSDRADRGEASRTTEGPPDLQAALGGTNQVAIAAAARAAGRRGDRNAAPALTALVRNPDPALRLAAAEALGHCGDSSAVPALIESLAGQNDLFTDHALGFALRLLATPGQLLAALDHPSANVQSVALLLLDQPPFEGATERVVIARLNATEPRLRNTARWVLGRHPDWGETVAAHVCDLIAQSDPTDAERDALRQFLPLSWANAAVISNLVQALMASPVDEANDPRARLLDLVAVLDMRDPPEILLDAVLRLLRVESATVRLAAIRASAAWRDPGAEEVLADMAHAAEQPDVLRAEALRELVRRKRVLEPLEMDFLLGQLGLARAPAARLAAAETLCGAKLTARQMAAFLSAVRGDSLISPAIVLDAITRQGFEKRLSPALIEFVVASLDAGWTFSADQLTSIQAAVPERDRVELEELISRVKEDIARQRETLAEFEPLLRGGDRVRGEQLFFGKAQCVVCHRVWENGGRVGPDLTSVGAIRAGRDLLESIVFPSATIAQEYDTWVVATKDGESLTGVRVGRSEDPLLLRDASGAEVTLHRRQIDRVDRSKRSLMPEGVLNALTREEVRDLLAYLQRLK